MKTKIIPAINAQTFEEIKEKLNLLKDLTQNFHLDVADLNFTGYQTWNKPQDLNKIEEVFLDLHLMISLKPQEILKWSKRKVKRLILHLEASENPDGLLKISKRTKKEIFISWSPNIDFEFIQKYLNYVNGVLVLGVNPGKAGQKFLPETYDRIKLVKEKLKQKQKLMVDGGVNEENFEKILAFEPDYIVMASAIYNKEDPRKEYLGFTRITQQIIADK